MTTNHAERLDAALIRSGRVDMKLELGYTNQDINARLFRAYLCATTPYQTGASEELKTRSGS